MRLATYNVEWFDHLFDDEGRLWNDDRGSGREGVSRAEQTQALGHVFRALDADAVLVIEAPDDNRRRDGAAALETFARRFGLRANRAVIGFPSDTQQEIAFLHDPAVLTVRHDPQGAPAGRQGGEGAVRFDGTFRYDLDGEGRPDLIRWSKPPLELAAESAGGTRFRLIGVHAKSKAPHGAKSPEEAMRRAIENRRTQLVQCHWLRLRVEAHLAAGDSVIVAGDFNDGPGLDEYEKLFGRSGVEIVLGEGNGARLFDPHARVTFAGRFAAQPASARFQVPPDGAFLSAMLDYIMISPDLRARSPRWRIWHPFDNPSCFADAALREALLLASDHFPVTLDIDL